VALFVVEVLAGVSCVDFGHALAEGVVAVVGGLPCCGVGGCGASPGCVVAVVEAAVAGEVACRVVAVAGGLCAALALQAVAVGIGAVTVEGGVVFYFFAAVAAQIVTVIGAAELGFAALAAGQAVELVVIVTLVLLGVTIVDGAGLPSGGVIAVVAAVGHLGLGIEAHADDDVAP